MNLLFFIVLLLVTYLLSFYFFPSIKSHSSNCFVDPPKFSGQYAGRGGWGMPWSVRYACTTHEKLPMDNQWSSIIHGTEWSNPGLFLNSSMFCKHVPYVCIWREHLHDAPTLVDRVPFPLPKIWFDMTPDYSPMIV
jgi:hypothetical protein